LTKVDAGNFKRELLNRLRSTMAVNVLSNIAHNIDMAFNQAQIKMF